MFALALNTEKRSLFCVNIRKGGDSMNKCITIFSLCVLSFCSFAAISCAQEMVDEGMPMEAEMYFASGVVDEASATQVVILEYDFDAGQEVKVAYQINAQTQFEGVPGYADIKSGDDIEIEYQVNGDQKIAIRIEKYTADMMEDVDTMSDAAEDVVQSATAEKINAENAAVEMGESPIAGQ